jgi:hypothetical protein
LSSTKSLLLAALLLAPLAATAEDAKAPKVTVSGMVDSFYTVNLSHAQDYTIPTSGYAGPTGFNLNFAKLTTVAELAPVTLRLDLGYGPEGVLITTGANPSRLFVQQAYASMKFGGFTVDAGRFVTPAGFEVFEAKDNWLYTKGLIFNYAVPTAHEGVRVGYAVMPELTLTGYLVNGGDNWTNDTGGAGSPYKTAALNALYVRDATTFAATVFYSYIPGTDGKSAFLADVVLTQGLGALSFNLSGDYGTVYNPALDADSTYYAVGGSLKYAVTDPLAVVARVEYLSDEDGVHTGAAAKSFVSVTGGLSYAVGSNASLRAELRYDKADENVYRSDKDSALSATLAAIAWF